MRGASVPAPLLRRCRCLPATSCRCDGKCASPLVPRSRPFAPLAARFPPQTVRPERSLAESLVARENPISRGTVRRTCAPSLKPLDHDFIEWPRLPRNFGLATSHTSIDEGSQHIRHSLRKVDVLPLQAEDFSNPHSSGGTNHSE